MKQIIIVFIALIGMISSSKFINIEKNRIKNRAEANALGVAFNTGKNGFAQANPNAYAINYNRL